MDTEEEGNTHSKLEVSNKDSPRQPERPNAVKHSAEEAGHSNVQKIEKIVEEGDGLVNLPNENVDQPSDSNSNTMDRVTASASITTNKKEGKDEPNNSQSKHSPVEEDGELTLVCSLCQIKLLFKHKYFLTPLVDDSPGRTGVLESSSFFNKLIGALSQKDLTSLVLLFGNRDRTGTVALNKVEREQSQPKTTEDNEENSSEDRHDGNEKQQEGDLEGLSGLSDALGLDGAGNVIKVTQLGEAQIDGHICNTQ
jgi:hypothetical protein